MADEHLDGRLSGTTLHESEGSCTTVSPATGGTLDRLSNSDEHALLVLVGERVNLTPELQAWLGTCPDLAAFTRGLVRTGELLERRECESCIETFCREDLRVDTFSSYGSLLCRRCWTTSTTTPIDWPDDPFSGKNALVEFVDADLVVAHSGCKVGTIKNFNPRTRMGYVTYDETPEHAEYGYFDEGFTPYHGYVTMTNVRSVLVPVQDARNHLH
jgi:hypothetical protein